MLAFRMTFTKLIYPDHPYLPRGPELQCSLHQLVFLTVRGHRHTHFSQILEYEVTVNLLSS